MHRNDIKNMYACTWRWYDYCLLNEQKLEKKYQCIELELYLG